MDPLQQYLMQMRQFTESYYIYSIPFICHNSEGEIPEELLHMCDVFIHQNVNTKAYGEKLTDEWITPGCPSIVMI